MNNMALTIITPLFNRDWCIADCIESVGLHAMSPDFRCEMIVVDDGSSDRSVSEVRNVVARLGLQEKVRLIQQPNAGPSIARNRGAKEAKGEWLVFLDSDDLWFPWTLRTLCETLASASSTVELAFIGARSFIDRSELLGIEERSVTKRLYPSFVDAVEGDTSSRYGTCNAAIRRTAFQELGGFEPELRCSEDSDLFLRVKGDVLTIFSPTLTALRRGHESLTGEVENVLKGFRWMAEKMRDGRYVGSSGNVGRFLAGSCAYSIRSAFAAGYPWTAYRLYLQNLGRLSSSRTRKYLIRLPLTPILHLRKPRGYPFRWRPKP